MGASQLPALATELDDKLEKDPLPRSSPELLNSYFKPSDDMRMTRAALRAQEAEDELHMSIEGKLRGQGLSSQSSSDELSEPLIHEDEDVERQQDNNRGINAGFGATNEPDGGRQALRDITAENYPVSSTDLVVLGGGEDEEPQGLKKTKSKKTKKTGSKKKEQLALEELPTEASFNSSDKVDNQNSQCSFEETLPIEVSHATIQTNTDLGIFPDNSAENFSESSQASQILENVPEDTNIIQHASQMDNITGNDLDGTKDPSELWRETPTKHIETVSKTPKFNPEIHLSAKETLMSHAEVNDDSFVESIKTRSPSKFSNSSLSSSQDDITLPNGHQITRTPSNSISQNHSPSPQRIEDSVEAIDALEDAIEQFTGDLPILEALPFESPIRSRKTPAKTSAPATVKTPAKTPSKAAVKAQTKTPAKMITKTPLNTSAKAATPKFSTPSIEKPNVKTPQTLTERMASTKRESVRERVKAIESKPTPAPHRRATSVHVLKKNAPEVRPTLKSKHMATKSVPIVTQPVPSSISFSNSPLKQDANLAKKRITSGGVLVTSKPGFVPAKSTKPITTSTFTLPGEAVAAKLKAQREERAKKEELESEKKTFRARPAPARTARPSVMPRENKASTARLSVRQASGENKENVAPPRTSTTAVQVKAAATSTVRTSTAATANSSTRRTTIAPKPTATIESRKSIAPTLTSAPVSAIASQRISSLTSGQQIVMSKTEVMQQKLKSKEAYDRIKGPLQQYEDERRAKEEAAKKARAEAAERGRQASREWAEKQKRKMAATTKPTTTAEITG